MSARRARRRSRRRVTGRARAACRASRFPGRCGAGRGPHGQTPVRGIAGCWRRRRAARRSGGSRCPSSLKPARMRSKTSGYCSGVRPAMVSEESSVSAPASTVSTTGAGAVRKSAGTSAAATSTGLAARGRGLATGLWLAAGLGWATGAGAGASAALTGAGVSFVTSGEVAQPVRAAARIVMGAKRRHAENPPVKSHPHGERRRTALRNMTVLLRWAVFKP